MAPEHPSARPSTMKWILGLAASAVACLLCAGALGLGLILAGNSPQLRAWLASPTPTRTATPRPTLTPIPTDTPTPDARDGWPVALSDTFSSNPNDWYIGDYDDEFGVADQRLRNGAFRWEITAKQGALWWDVPEGGPVVSDFTFTADLEQVSGPPDADYGVLFRVADDDNFYYFALSVGQLYAFFILEDNEWRTLIDWTEAEIIQPDGVNTVTVSAEGPRFTFFVNGEQVASHEDDTLPSGEIGLAISMQDEGDTGVFEFDNLEVRAP